MTDKPIAIVTGVTGQTGSWMCELLLQKGWQVVGIIRRSSTNTLDRLKNVLSNSNLTIVEGDITDYNSISAIVEKYKPEVFYNFCAQSHVGTSFSQPALTFQVNTIGVLNALESIKNFSPDTKFFQASTSEMFGSNFDYEYDTGEKIQNENTRFAPNSPYAVSKLAAFELGRVYKNSYGLKVYSTLMFNNESIRRGENFVTRKITKYIGGLVNHLELEKERYNTGNYWDAVDLLGKNYPKLKLGNIESYRDWSDSRDVCDAIYLIMQEDVADYYVIANGTTHSVIEFLELAFEYAGLNYRDYVEIDETLKRPCEVPYLRGDSSKLRNKLGWQPKYTFEDLVRTMVEHDIKEASNGFVRLHQSN